ncbi:MAG TPA: squalene synthase HpnC [Alcaligenes sp.]|nr:squalene synthase HpnC [Alcaligenes sp.]HRL27156.1 squalene synthase HpnC [Alcaligenes sp.]
MSIEHYENFPVASVLLPRRLRRPVVDIYRFARSADDIADEGDLSADERLALLDQFQAGIEQLQYHQPALVDAPHSHIFVPLAATIRNYQLPLKPFLDLLSAFRQDVTTQRYADMTQLLDYCSRSANPVGRLMLHLYQAHDPERLEMADAVCTGLQLVNFWQDVALDWHKNRVYIPQELLQRYDLDDDYIQARCSFQRHPGADERWQELMALLASDARQRLQSGLPLAALLPGRIGLELKLMILGGLRILERLQAVQFDMFSHRPTLTRLDWLRLTARGLGLTRAVR